MVEDVERFDRSSIERVPLSDVRWNTEKSAVTIFGPRTCPIS